MKKWIYFILIILSFILYGNSIYNDYAIDDEYITGSAVQNGLAGIPYILTHRYNIEEGKIALDYRPIVLVSYAIEYQFFGQAPHISHFINIFLYALCIIALYNVLISVFKLQKKNEWLPLVITLLFAIHPIHTEVVNSLKNRDELFSFLFGMLFLKNGYNFFITQNNKLKLGLIAYLFFVMSLFSKMSGLLFLPLLILIIIFNKLHKWNKWNYLFLSSCFFLILLIFSLIFYGLKRETYSFENSLIGVNDFWLVFATSLKIIFYHIKMLFLPQPLRFYYGSNMFPVQSILEPIVLFSLIFHILLFTVGLYKFIKKEIIGLTILSYFVCMYLYSNFPIPYTGMFSERALFLSSVWFIVTVVIFVFFILEKVKSKFINQIIYALFLFVFCFYAYLTINRNFYWKNTFTLVSEDIKTLENSIVGNYTFANLLNKKSKETTDSIYSKYLSEEAVKYYQQTINLYPYYPDFFYKMARVYRYQLNDIIKAETQFKNILKIDENNIGANFELGKLYFDRKQFGLSYPYFNKTYQLNKTDSITLFYFAQNALILKDFNTCYKINKEFIGLYPNNKYPYLNLGVYYSTIMKDDSAVIYFEKGIALGDRNPALINQLAIYYNGKNNKTKANYFLELLK